MHKDPNLRKRDALAIPGGLLALFSLVGILYVALLRGDEGTCGDAALVVFAGDCRPAVLLLAIPFVVGVALLAVGAVRFRSRATCRLGHGSWAHFGLAALITLTVLPALAAVLAPFAVGPDAAVVSGDVEYPVTTLLAGLAGVGFVALVPYGLLYASRDRSNPCCREKGCFEPCFCDEPIAAPEPEPAPAEPAAEAPAAPVAPPPPAPAPEPEPAPAAEAWEAAPEEPTLEEEGWEIVPDEPDERVRAEAPSAPPLAVRPTDPAAEPSDEMAHAAQMAQEEQGDEEGAGASKPARRRKPAKKAAKAKPKKKA